MACNERRVWAVEYIWGNIKKYLQFLQSLKYELQQKLKPFLVDVYFV